MTAQSRIHPPCRLPHCCAADGLKNRNGLRVRQSAPRRQCSAPVAPPAHPHPQTSSQAHVSTPSGQLPADLTSAIRRINVSLHPDCCSPRHIHTNGPTDLQTPSPDIPPPRHQSLAPLPAETVCPPFALAADRAWGRPGRQRAAQPRARWRRGGSTGSARKFNLDIETATHAKGIAVTGRGNWRDSENVPSVLRDWTSASALSCSLRYRSSRLEHRPPRNTGSPGSPISQIRQARLMPGNPRPLNNQKP